MGFVLIWGRRLAVCQPEPAAGLHHVALAQRLHHRVPRAREALPVERGALEREGAAVERARVADLAHLLARCHLLDHVARDQALAFLE